MTSAYGMGAGAFTVLDAYTGDLLLCFNGTIPDGGSPSAPGPASDTPYTYFAINLNSTVDPIGTILWTNPVSPPTANVTITFGGVDPTVGVFVEGYKETMQWVGYSLTTGKQIWGPVGNQSAFDYYGNHISPIVLVSLLTGTSTAFHSEEYYTAMI